MTRNAPTDEFYVGYLPKAPERLARFIKRTILALGALAVTASAVLVVGQRPFARSTFEFQQYREFAGTIELNPYPMLLVPRPGAGDSQTLDSRYLLVGTGKHGADAEVSAFAGTQITLRGSLIYRDGQTMIELVPGSLAQKGVSPHLSVSPVRVGEVVVTGEIIDSKCYLGVMNPGQTKVHRDCAVRCISGGIPPMLVTAESNYLLVGTDGRKLNREVLDIVGEVVEIAGVVQRSGESLTLMADPATYRRVRQ